MKITGLEKEQIPEIYWEYTEAELQEIILQARADLGTELLILAHHYQKDEVVAFADEVGDSLQLAQSAKRNQTAKHVVFCGVHFMAETADMLTMAHQRVYLPDRHAGCFMADMANAQQLERAWAILQRKYPNQIIPITYINSSAAVKAFVGEHGGGIVTSSNAEKILRWAFTQKKIVFFLPDQHLGRNTAFKMGIPLSQMGLWNPYDDQLELKPGVVEETLRVILWDGWCGVHQQFTVQQIQALRKKDPAIKVIVHPECPLEVVEAADDYGSTNKILSTVEASAPDSHWAIGTDHNLVGRMQKVLPQKISFINPIACACLTMNRIQLPHLAWCLHELAEGRAFHAIEVDAETTDLALLGLERMLALS